MSKVGDDAVAFIAALADTDVELTDAERIDEITALEELKAACAARQARLTDAFAVSQRDKLIKAGAKTVDARRSVCAQVGLARRDSPSRGNRHVGLAHTLVHELPRVLDVLAQGRTSEWRVTLIARETAHLTREHRAVIDTAIAEHLHAWGDARTEREARAWAQRLDPHGAAERAAKATADRRVSIRCAPDCMTYLTALLPVKEGVGVYGMLHRAAMTAHCDPDDHRTKGQVMADELTRRILTPGQREPEHPALELHLVMTDRTLADTDTEPAQLIGYGPIPAPLARDLVLADEQTRVWVRRLYTNPTSGELISTDARRRDFPHTARAFLIARDQICRTPYCGSPIRHTDHTIATSRGGTTTLTNGNGRCAHCNLTKDTSGWATHVDKDGAIITTTPTGHHHPSRPPRPPTSTPWPPTIEIDIQWPGHRDSG